MARDVRFTLTSKRYGLDPMQVLVCTSQADDLWLPAISPYARRQRARLGKGRRGQYAG